MAAMESVKERALTALSAMGVQLAVAAPRDYLAAKVAATIESGCTRKIRYESERAAKGAISGLKRRKAIPKKQWMDAYACPHCGHWHIAQGLPR